MKIQNISNPKRKLYLATLLSFSFLNGGLAYGDSTFFPEDKTAEKPVQDASDAIKEWAELKPTPKKIIPQEKPENTEATLTQPQTPTETDEKQKPTETLATTPESNASLTEAPTTPPTDEEKKPTETLAAFPESNTSLTEVSETAPAIEEKKPTETLAALPESNTSLTEAPATPPVVEEKKPADTLAALPESNTSLTEASATPPATDEKKPLEITKVVARPKAVPVQEEPQAPAPATGQAIAQGKVISYSEAANDRSPLGILSPNQEVHNHKWSIYAAAIRGQKNPSDKIQIVSMVGTPPKKGEDIQKLLTEEMGITAEIQLIRAQGEENQAGTIYIFAGK